VLFRSNDTTLSTAKSQLDEYDLQSSCYRRGVDDVEHAGDSDLNQNNDCNDGGNASLSDDSIDMMMMSQFQFKDQKEN
jgi:hypothetical protein